MKTLGELLDGQPAVKACLYFLASVLPVIGAAMATWTELPPANGYEVGAVIVAAFSSGIITLKAFTSDPKSKP